MCRLQRRCRVVQLYCRVAIALILFLWHAMQPKDKLYSSYSGKHETAKKNYRLILLLWAIFMMPKDMPDEVGRDFRRWMCRKLEIM
jgi:hypothetical protein